MNPSEIKVDHTYRNRGKGSTRRTVLVISEKIKPDWSGRGPKPKEPGVRFRNENGRYPQLIEELYLSSFANWAGEDVT